MNLSALFVLVLCSEIISQVKAQNSSGSNPVALRPVRPSATMVVSILSVMLAVSFILLVYARFCHNTTGGYLQNLRDPHHLNPQQLIRTRSRLSGIDRTIIESLPFFGFSSIKGSKEGLECAICLSKFEDSDVLRLLTKCKHGFHIGCIDRWLECHSSCPLCRYKFDPKDPKNFTCSNSWRFLQVNSNLADDPNIEIFLHREEDDCSRGSSSRLDKGNEELLIQYSGRNDDKRKRLLDKVKHRIVVSDVVTKNRWSDVNPSDMLFLNSEMTGALSSQRFCLLESSSGRLVKEDIERKMFEAKITNVGEKRSVSEIANFPRLKQTSAGSCYRAPDGHVNRGNKEESVQRLWLPIVRRTVHWFAGRHENLEQPESHRSHCVNAV